MPDIRSFFGAKGGAGAAPAKPAAKKEEPPAKKGRTKGRKVVEDSEEEEDPVIETKKPATRSTPRKKAVEPAAVKGVEISASDYFASSKSKPAAQATPKKTVTGKSAPKAELEVRVSPRTRQTAARETAASEKNGRAGGTTKKPVTAYKKYDLDEDEDAYLDDADDGDDIFAADVKGHKRKNDDYAEDESEEEFLPKPKRVASRAKPGAAKAVKDEDSDEDVKPVPKKVARAAPANTSVSSKKRKTPADSDSEQFEDEADKKPRKKPAAAAKLRAAPKAKKAADEDEDANIKSIVDNIPTVRPPTPPPQDPNKKFDWRKAAAGGGNSGPPPNPGAIEIPEGEPNCLAGQTFVFTGILKTIGREEAQALVKRYGGKVMSAPSRNTKWVVLGDDAGPSKLKKIRELNIKTIDENGLFQLIRALPASGGDGKDAEKARQKQQEQEDKAKQAAIEMEREEKARLAEAAKAQKAAQKATGARGAVARPAPQPNAQLWTTKYAPTQLNQICGNKGQVEKISKWLAGWPKAHKYGFQARGADGLGSTRAILISGPPGIGKTTAAHLAAKLAGYDAIETNASDARSKKLIEGGIGDAINNTSLLGYFAGDGSKVNAEKKNIVLIMDEVDGMSAGDRGGIVALAKFCKTTEVPLILICNDRRLPKMKPFDHVAYDMKFIRPTVDQIRSRIMTICHREGLKIPPQVVDALIEGSNRDIRQIINMISTAKLDQEAMDFDQSKSMTKAWEKHVVLKPWDICSKLLGSQLWAPTSKATLNDKIELYFNDHEFSYLMIQENYLHTKPMALYGKGYNKREENLKYLELVDQAAESISDGDLFDRMIHGPQQQWSLMPEHAVFSTIRPASLIAGQLMGPPAFTSWLGMNSKAGKLGRYVREIHSHMRLKSSGDHNEIRQQYLPVLWYQLIKRLEVEGKDSIDDVIELMDSYYLTRDDFDAINELGVGPQDESKASIETQTKAAFTRKYNAMSHPIPFIKASTVTATKRTTREAPDLEEAIEESEDEAELLEPAELDESDDVDLKGDKYIKQPKAKAKRGPKKSKAKEADEDDVDDDEANAGPSKGRGKGKATAAAGRGRGRGRGRK